MRHFVAPFALLALGFVSPAFAELNTSSFDGPYIGWGVGSQHNDVNKENVRATTGDPSFDQPDASDKNLFGQITAGYGHDFFRRFNVSANLFTISVAAKSTTSRRPSTKIQLNRSSRTAGAFFWRPAITQMTGFLSSSKRA